MKYESNTFYDLPYPEVELWVQYIDDVHQVQLSIEMDRQTTLSLTYHFSNERVFQEFKSYQEKGTDIYYDRVLALLRESLKGGTPIPINASAYYESLVDFLQFPTSENLTGLETRATMTSRMYQDGTPYLIIRRDWWGMR